MARAMDGSCAAAGAMASGEPLERDNQDERAAEYGGVPRIRGSRPRGRTGSMARGTLAPGLRATACAHVIVSGESSAPGSEWEFDVLRGLEVELGAGVGQAAEYDGVRGSGGRGQADCIHGAGCCSWERGPLCTVHGKVTDVVDTPPRQRLSGVSATVSLPCGSLGMVPVRWRGQGIGAGRARSPAVPPPGRRLPRPHRCGLDSDGSGIPGRRSGDGDLDLQVRNANDLPAGATGELGSLEVRGFEGDPVEGLESDAGPEAGFGTGQVAEVLAGGGGLCLGITPVDVAGGADVVDGRQTRPVEIEEGARVSWRKASTSGSRRWGCGCARVTCVRCFRSGTRRGRCRGSCAGGTW